MYDSVLPQGIPLRVNDFVYHQSGGQILTRLEYDQYGFLTLWDSIGGGVLWQYGPTIDSNPGLVTGYQGARVAYAMMQTDGNLCLYQTGGCPNLDTFFLGCTMEEYWCSGTNTWGQAPYSLVVDEVSVYILDGLGDRLWQVHMSLHMSFECQLTS